MSSLAAIEPIGGAVAQEADGHLYIALIQRAMQAKDISLRSLSMRAGISKSRLGRILHSNCAERASITLSEFRVLLEALEIDLIQAIIKVESIRDQKVLADERYVALIAMLANLFKAAAIETAGVPTLFAESSQPDRLVQVLASEVGIDVDVVELFTESLTEPGEGADTYLAMMRENTARISEGLTR